MELEPPPVSLGHVVRERSGRHGGAGRLRRRRPRARAGGLAGRRGRLARGRRPGRVLLARDPAARSRSTARSSTSTTAACAPARAWCTRRSSGTSTSRTSRPSTTCGRSSSRASRPCGAGSRREFGCDPEGTGHHAQRERSAADRAARHRPQARRRGADHDQDYPRMLWTWDQRARRDGITVVEGLRSRCRRRARQYLADMFEKAITPRTKVILLCHITNLTGQIFPVREICRMARARGIRTIVDGAHAFAHFPFKAADLECDYYGCSLHKWLTAPSRHGVPLRAARAHRGHLADAARRRRPWTTTSASSKRSARTRRPMHNAIAEALVFLHGIGIERKAARLRYLKNRWARRVEKVPGRAHAHEPSTPRSRAAWPTSASTRSTAAKLAELLLDEVPHHRRRPSSTTTTRASASRRTSTRRSTRSTRSREIVEDVARRGSL